MLKLKDIIALGLLGVVTFPVVLLGVLLWTGNVRLVFGPEARDPNARAKLLERPEDIPGATLAPADSNHGAARSGSAMNAGELDEREAEVLRETRRLEDLRLDNVRLRDTIRAERERLERLLLSADSLEGKRTEVLAATFTGMKADQAGKILSALDDVIVTAVLRKVSDDKGRAKLLAALGKIDVQRAARVARLLENGHSTARTANRESVAPPTQPAPAKDTVPAAPEKH